MESHDSEFAQVPRYRLVFRSKLGRVLDSFEGTYQEVLAEQQKAIAANAMNIGEIERA